jgi:hypothetical protein
MLRRVVAVLATLLIVEYLILPQLAGVRLELLARINVGYLLLGIALEAAFLVAHAKLTWSVLPKGSEPGLLTVLRVNLSTLAVSHLVPGGTAAGTALGYRLLTQSGVRGAECGFALGMQGIASAAVLNLLLWLSLVVSIPVRGFDPLYVTAAVIAAVVIGGFLGLVYLFTRGEARAERIMRAIARRLPFLDEDVVHRGVHRVAKRLRILLSDRPLLARVFGWAAAAWLFDAASLGVFVAAFGHRPSPDGLLIAFALANVLAAIPVTPRGLGVVEAVLIPSLVGFGAPRPIAVLGVISYRFFNFWAPIPVGGMAYLSLRAKNAPLKEKARAVRLLGEFSVEKAETPREWAARHGLKIDRLRPE